MEYSVCIRRCVKDGAVIPLFYRAGMPGRMAFQENKAAVAGRPHAALPPVGRREAV
jgi:hypothetical protein